MKELPIIFNGEMVRAIFEGRKTQTRRPIRPQPLWFYDGMPIKTPDADPKGSIKSPFGKPGDILWVRETHYRWTGCGNPPSSFNRDRCYSNHRELSCMDSGCCLVKVPSIHMPRWASRIRLRVNRVWVERVQDITIEDIIKEGIQTTLRGHEAVVDLNNKWFELWNSIYGTLDDNPWVWCCEFDVEEVKK